MPSEGEGGAEFENEDQGEDDTCNTTSPSENLMDTPASETLTISPSFHGANHAFVVGTGNSFE